MDTSNEELIVGLTENVDYFLLPSFQALRFYEKYGGGPRIPRDVVNVGTAYLPRLQICLYRIRLEVYHCTLQFSEPDKLDKKLFKVFHFDKSATVKEMTQEIRNAFNVPFLHSSRLWIKRPTDASMTVDSGVTVKKEQDRLMTVDVTDRDGEWVYMRHLADKTTALEMAEDSSSLELILESTAKSKAESKDWPRGHLLEKVGSCATVSVVYILLGAHDNSGRMLFGLGTLWMCATWARSGMKHG